MSALAPAAADPVADRDGKADASAAVPPDPSSELAVTVGRNLRRLRTRRGYSLERMAKLSGVSRAMLSQIEHGRSTPTISLLWKVATALDVTFATLTSSGPEIGTQLLRKDRAKVLASSQGRFTSRALFPFVGERKVEFYELRLAGRHTEAAEAHAAGTVENLVVTKGSVEIFDGHQTYALNEGDALVFEADLPHSYRNSDTGEAVIHLVMIYVETIG